MIISFVVAVVVGTGFDILERAYGAVDEDSTKRDRPAGSAQSNGTPTKRTSPEATASRGFTTSTVPKPSSAVAPTAARTNGSRARLRGPRSPVSLGGFCSRPNGMAVIPDAGREFLTGES